MSQRVAGKIAVVTGANRGMGLETCRQLARLGARVVLTSRDPAKGEAAARELRTEKLDVRCHQLDVADDASIGRLAGVIERELGRLDILINNAAIVRGDDETREQATSDLRGHADRLSPGAGDQSGRALRALWEP